MTETPKPVRWGILGTARIATKVAAAIRQVKNAELTGIASRSQESAQLWAEEHAAGRTYGSYLALLDDPDIDAVYIPLPPSMHAEWTIRAAEKGKHVLCEKPLAVSTAQTEEMWAACREHGVQLMDGVMWVHHPRSAEMLRLIREHQLGDIQRVTSAFSFRWDEIPEADLRLQRDLGGGALLDLGWYCVGAACWAFDETPHRVFGTGRYHNDVDLSFSGLLWFSGDRTSGFDCGFESEMRRWMEVAGTQASLVCDDFTRPWKVEKPRFWMHDKTGKVSETVAAPVVQEACMIETFCRLINEGQLDERWPLTAIRTQRVCEALDRSARTGQVVELPQ